MGCHHMDTGNLQYRYDKTNQGRIISLYKILPSPPHIPQLILVQFLKTFRYKFPLDYIYRMECSRALLNKCKEILNFLFSQSVLPPSPSASTLFYSHTSPYPPSGTHRQNSYLSPLHTQPLRMQSEVFPDTFCYLH